MPHQDGLFFRVLRRFNMLLMALVGLGALLLIGVFLFRHPLTQLALARLGGANPVEQAAKPAPERFYLQAEWFPSQNAYPPIVRDKVLYVQKRTTGAPGAAAPGMVPGEGEQDVNILVIDDNGDGHWLFETRDQVILDRTALYAGPQNVGAQVGTDSREITGLVLQVAEDDTNNDGKLDSSDEITIYYWRKGREKLVKVLTADGLAGVGPTGEDRYAVFYDKDKAKYVAIYALPDFEQVSVKQLPEAPK